MDPHFTVGPGTMNRSWFIPAFGLLFLASLAGLTPTAEAAPTFDAAQTISQVNMDNGYTTFVSDDEQLVVIAHVTDAGLAVVDVSTNGGQSFETRGTGVNVGVSTRIRVAARDADHILITYGTSLIRTTTNGYTFVSSTLFSGGSGNGPWYEADIDYKDGKYLAVMGKCVTASGSNPPCATQPNPDLQLNYRVSSDDGATWTAVQAIAAWDVNINNNVIGNLMPVAIAMRSATEWEVVVGRYSDAFSSFLLNHFQTVNGAPTSADWTPAVGTVNDQFAPLSSTSPGFGYELDISNEGSAISFSNDADIWAGTLNPNSGLWAFARISQAANLANWKHPVFSCGDPLDPKTVVLWQGPSGSDRVTFAESYGGTVTNTAVTGTTDTVARPFSGFRIGDNIHVVYGDLATGRTLIKKTTNDPCVVGEAAELLPAASATVTGLVAMDVDPTGSTLIARVDGGDKVQTWDAQGLGAAGATFDTNCAPVGSVVRHAVTAAIENVAYLDCNSDAQLSIRSSVLGDPTLPPGCSDTGNFDSWNVVGFDEAKAQEIADMGYLSINWDVRSDGSCFALATLVVGTTDGRIGIIGGMFGDGPFVEKGEEFKQYTASTTPAYYVCGQTYSDAVNDPYDPEIDVAIVASSPGASTVAYKWNHDVTNPALTQVRVFGGPLGSQDSVDCTASDEGRIILGSSLATRAASLVTGEQLWSRTDIKPNARGVAISLDGNWAVSVAGTTAYLLNGTSGQTITSFTIPAGAYRDVAIDSSGQNIWVATDTAIARYEVYELTTITPEDTCVDTIAPVCEDTPTVPVDDEPGSVFNPAGAALPPGFTAATWDFFSGLLLTFACGAGLFFALKMNVWAGLAGLVLGFLAAFAFGLFEPWILLVVVVLAVATIFLKVKGAAAS